MAAKQSNPAPEDEADPGVPEWVVTYGDMMSLLLTFFIMLVSMSETKSDDGAMRAMMDAINQAFGHTEGLNAVPGPSFQTTSEFNTLSSEGKKSEGGTEKAGIDSKGRVGAHTTVSRINHGTVVTPGGMAQFARFDAKLSDALKADLEIIATVVGPKPNRMMIRGHASPEPLPADSPYFDQFDLSFARARAVSEFLVTKGIDRNRILVSAAGDNELRAKTRDFEQQKLNRRVDVFLIDSYISHPRTLSSAR